MFDANREIRMDVENREAPEGKKTCQVRWPTEEQWLRYNGQLRLITKPGADGVGSMNEIEGDAVAEEELYKGIVVSEEPALDASERSEVIDRLQWQRLREVKREGDVVVVKIGVPGAETVHRLAIPTAAEKKNYRNAIPAAVDLGRDKTVMYLTIAPQVKFYDVLNRGAEGYVDGIVPPIHKATAIRALLAKLDDSGDDRDFF